MLIILPNLKHSFISPVPVPVPVPDPVPLPDPDFPVFHTPAFDALGSSVLVQRQAGSHAEGS